MTGGARTRTGLRVLMVTSEWPSPAYPCHVPFLVRQVEALRGAGVDVTVFAFMGRRNPWNYAAAWLRLRRRHRWRDFDLVHLQFGQSGLVAMPTPLPVVVTFRGSDVHGIVKAGGGYTMTGRVLRAVSRWVARRADAVVVVSPQLTEALPPGIDAHVIPAGLDLTHFRPMHQKEARRRLGLPDTGRLVLFAASPAKPVKRYALAQQVVEQVQASLPDVGLIVLDGVPHTDVPYYMNACDALLLTSLHEGSPNVVKEALACNLPVVSVEVGDVRERLEGVEGCKVVAGDTVEELAVALAAVLLRGLRIQGQGAVQKLDGQYLTAQLIDVYRSILQHTSRSAVIAPSGAMEKAY